MHVFLTEILSHPTNSPGTVARVILFITGMEGNLRTINFLLVLILLLILTACMRSEKVAPPAVEDTLPETYEQATGDAGAAGTPTTGPIATNTLPVPTLEPTATAQPTDEPVPTITPLRTPEPLSTETQAQIYAAAIRQMYGVEHSFGGDPPQKSLVFIRGITDDGSLLYAPVTEEQKITAELRQAIESELSDQPFKIVWVETIDEVPVEESGGIDIARGEGIFITPGNILPQPDGTVHLPFYMLCGTLCLSGKTYVLKAEQGAWQVTGSVGAEIEG